MKHNYQAQLIEKDTNAGYVAAQQKLRDVPKALVDGVVCMSNNKVVNVHFSENPKFHLYINMLCYSIHLR